jgi:hypothetical protein
MHKPKVTDSDIHVRSRGVRVDRPDVDKPQVKDPDSSVQFENIRLIGKIRIHKNAHGRPHPEAVTIDTWDCASASGRFTSPTTRIIDCYLQNDQDPSLQYHANTINNNDPTPGEWNASNFPPNIPHGLYDMCVKGDDKSSNCVGPLICF